VRSLTVAAPLFAIAVGTGCTRVPFCDAFPDQCAAEDTETGETGSVEGDGDTGDEDTGDGDGDTGDGDGNTGDGDGDTGDGDGDGDAGDGDGDAGDGDGDTGTPECTDFETQEECDANLDCQSVSGWPLLENGPDAPCLEPPEFLGCIGMMPCNDVETWFCIEQVFLVFDSCGPENGESCDPGVMDPPECP
jgi:hypothetical protein